MFDQLLAAVDNDTVEAIRMAVQGLREEKTADWTFLYWVLGGIGTALIGITAAFSKAMNWTAANVVVPLKDRHIRFMDQTEQTQIKLTECASSIVTKLDGIDERQARHIEICEGAHAAPGKVSRGHA